ncbi:hypothetical protein KUF71_013885 [Frankliniella fusca]|uniref:Uncharacterized protein n=1 Tax=Frankliniella fusca TaxID=407009 RepID=A0AAE1HRT7_9NEOP|nr:hypothetical protein KUF71_013885 [Frankliniella fusca]
MKRVAGPVLRARLIRLADPSRPSRIPALSICGGLSLLRYRGGPGRQRVCASVREQHHGAQHAAKGIFRPRANEASAQMSGREKVRI